MNKSKIGIYLKDVKFKEIEQFKNLSILIPYDENTLNIPEEIRANTSIILQLKNVQKISITKITNLAKLFETIMINLKYINVPDMLFLSHLCFIFNDQVIPLLNSKQIIHYLNNINKFKTIGLLFRKKDDIKKFFKIEKYIKVRNKVIVLDLGLEHLKEKLCTDFFNQVIRTAQRIYTSNFQLFYYLRNFEDLSPDKICKLINDGFLEIEVA